MEPVHPEFVPDPSTTRAEMEALQREIAAAAVFEDDTGGPIRGWLDGDSREPLIAGVDQAFHDDRAVSAIVVIRGNEVVERVTAATPLDTPYIPGLLSFREGTPILAAAAELEAVPDLLLFDGNGRLHYRQAGLATHLGVVFDVPSVGVAKSLLCGEPRMPLDDLPAGTRVAILADDEVDAPGDAVIGYAVQTRQFTESDRRVNPVYASPGHRVSAETAADVVLATGSGYKLPSPIRLADRAADEAKAALE